MEVLNLERLGDSLQAIGRTLWTTRPPGSHETVPVYLKFVAIYKWEEGEWKITLNIFNKMPPV